MNTPIIYWFRQDLRTHDLPGLAAAAATGRPLLACYILDDKTPGDWRLGGASRWWLHHSLQSMDEALRKLGGRLILRSGETGAVLDTLIAESGADSVYCSQHFEPWAIDLEQRLHADFEKRDLTIKRFPGLLLFQPGTVLNQSGLPFKVYTPFWRACRAGDAPLCPGPARRISHGTQTATVNRWMPGHCAPLSQTGQPDGAISGSLARQALHGVSRLSSTAPS